MLTLSPTLRIYLCSAPTDMRRGFDRLAAEARAVVDEDPLSGHLFVFRNKLGDRLKVLTARASAARRSKPRRISVGAEQR
ncbi:MAG: IS66 family insertion sequence element accessory protein TnpB [Sumerlaeia bacterium]